MVIEQIMTKYKRNYSQAIGLIIDQWVRLQQQIEAKRKELDQVEAYLDVILKQPEFNASNMYWEFYLVGNSLDSTGYIERQYKNVEIYGEKSLVFKNPRYKTYVKTWSEIFADFELRHEFLNEKLELERDKLTSSELNADEIISNIRNNTAAQPS